MSGFSQRSGSRGGSGFGNSGSGRLSRPMGGAAGAAGAGGGPSRLNPGEVFSQPANTGSGFHENTQLASAIEALKKEGKPVRLEDFAVLNGLNGLLDASSSLFRRFAAHERTVHDAKLDLWNYKPDYDLSSGADVVRLLAARFNTKKPGMKLSEIRESYPAAKEAIEELIRIERKQDRELLILRGPKDQGIRHVFWNPIRGDEATPVAAEFRDLWHSLQTPNEVDLQHEMEKEGLSTTAMLNTGPPPGARGRKNARGGRKGAGSRRVKITNTHLEEIDLSKDFVKKP